MGIEDMGDVPFRTVYLHGLVRDDKGDKMSKTKGNVVDPRGLINEYGTDALRFALSTGITPGNDTRITLSKIEAGRNFANKLWNATRFVIRSLESGGGFDPAIDRGKLAVEDRWILSRLNRVVDTVTCLLDEFQFGEAQRQAHDFLWGEYCDWYIELAKIRLQAGDNTPLPVLAHVLEKSLRLLHPFMPFLTEELWQNLKKMIKGLTGESIMVAPYPEADKSFFDAAAEAEIEAVMEIVRTIRNVRTQYKVDMTRWIEAQIYVAAARFKAISGYTAAVNILARAKPVTFLQGEPAEKPPENTLVMPLAQATVLIPMASMFDMEAEKKRIEKEMEGARAEVARLEARLNDTSFLAKAPPAVVEKERQKLYTLNDKLEKLKQQTENRR
jgi:valyl-tRNA synthetase